MKQKQNEWKWSEPPSYGSKKILKIRPLKKKKRLQLFLEVYSTILCWDHFKFPSVEEENDLPAKQTHAQNWSAFDKARVCQTRSSFGHEFAQGNFKFAVR